MSDMDNGSTDGSISAAGRFGRMEAALDRIEQKLDSKADMSTVEMRASENRAMILALAGRVSSLEIADSNRAAVASAIKATADARYRTVWLVVGFLTIVNVALGAVVAAIAIVHGIQPV